MDDKLDVRQAVLAEREELAALLDAYSTDNDKAGLDGAAPSQRARR